MPLIATSVHQETGPNIDFVALVSLSKAFLGTFTVRSLKVTNDETLADIDLCDTDDQELCVMLDTLAYSDELQSAVNDHIKQYNIERRPLMRSGV